MAATPADVTVIDRHHATIFHDRLLVGQLRLDRSRQPQPTRRRRGGPAKHAAYSSELSAMSCDIRVGDAARQNTVHHERLLRTKRRRHLPLLMIDLVGLGQPTVKLVVEVSLGSQQQLVHPVLSFDVPNLREASTFDCRLEPEPCDQRISSQANDAGEAGAGHEADPSPDLLDGERADGLDEPHVGVDQRPRVRVVDEESSTVPT
jgi:hypothetical protein